MPIEQSLLPWLPKSPNTYDGHVDSQLCMVHRLEPAALFCSSLQEDEERTLEPELGPREARDFHASTIFNDLQWLVK